MTARMPPALVEQLVPVEVANPSASPLGRPATLRFVPPDSLEYPQHSGSAFPDVTTAFALKGKTVIPVPMIVGSAPVATVLVT